MKHQLNCEINSMSYSTLFHSSSSFKFTHSLSHPPLQFSSFPFPVQLKPNKYHFNFKFTKCRALFSDDAPFAAAIGACMLSSLVFPVSSPRDDDDADSALNSTDTRLAVMGIVSFIPFFNWLSWVFAWLDTGERRYAVYALVYFAPYLRSNLSLSPEESWLPIASILFCIVHIQLEASIRNGDIQGFQLFRNLTGQPSSSNRKKGHLNQQKESSYEEGSNKEKRNLPHAKEQSRIIQDWEDSQRPLQYRQRLNEDSDDDVEERSKH